MSGGALRREEIGFRKPREVGGRGGRIEAIAELLPENRRDGGSGLCGTSGIQEQPSRPAGKDVLDRAGEFVSGRVFSCLRMSSERYCSASTQHTIPSWA